MIIWVASYPRSGNTYLRMLLYHGFGITTHTVSSDLLFDREWATEIVGQKPLPGTFKEAASANEVYFVKTHNLPHDNRPALYIVRDGRDALVSHARYRMSFGRGGRSTVRATLRKLLYRMRGFDRTLRHLIESNEEYGGWSRNVLSWTKDRKGGQTVSVRYEDLLEDPLPQVREALDSLGVESDFQGSAPPTFQSLHQKWPDFFRKGTTGTWRTEMPPELHDLFWDHHGVAMEALGYER